MNGTSARFARSRTALVFRSRRRRPHHRLMVADPDTAFGTAMGVTAQAAPFGSGIRSQRYAAVVRDGRIERLDVEAHIGNHDVSTAEAVLSALRG